MMVLLSFSTTLFAVNTAETWVFNNGKANEYEFKYLRRDETLKRDVYYCEAILPESMFQVRFHSQNGYSTSSYDFYLSTENLSTSNQVEFDTWYPIANSQSSSVQWSNFATFRNSGNQNSYVFLEVYDDGTYKICFSNDFTTSISNTIRDLPNEAEYYNLQGIKVDNNVSGFVIKRVGNKSEKIQLNK